MTAKEKAIQNYMKSLEISREEAEQLWEDDQEDFIGEEGEAMTEKAKELKNYTQADVTKEKKKRERKIDNDKVFILENLNRGVALLPGYIKVTVENDTKLHFEYNDNSYTVTLTKHRK